MAAVRDSGPFHWKGKELWAIFNRRGHLVANCGFEVKQTTGFSTLSALLVSAV